MTYRNIHVRCNQDMYVVVIADDWGDFQVYSFTAMSSDLAKLNIDYVNKYYRFMTLQEYMSLPYIEGHY